MRRGNKEVQPIIPDFKLVLRTTKQIYNIFQNGLFIACTLINDMSLLSVDVIQRTVVSQDEVRDSQTLKNGLSMQ